MLPSCFNSVSLVSVIDSWSKYYWSDKSKSIPLITIKTFQRAFSILSKMDMKPLMSSLYEKNWSLTNELVSICIGVCLDIQPCIQLSKSRFKFDSLIWRASPRKIIFCIFVCCVCMHACSQLQRLSVCLSVCPR